MKNQAFYARLRNARSLFRFGRDVHSELNVLKRNGMVVPFNATAVTSWSKWTKTGTFKSSGKALTRRERKRLARRMYRTKSYRYPGITLSQAFTLTKSAYPKKSVTIQHSALRKSLRNSLPYWLTTGVTVCNLELNNDWIMRKPGQEVIDASEKSITINLEDPDSVAKGVRIARRSLRRL